VIRQIKKTIVQEEHKIKFWIKVVVAFVSITIASYIAGSFHPNTWTTKKIIKDTENQMVSEWNQFGFHKPSIEYSTDIEFIMAVGRCVDYLNLHHLHEERVHKYIIVAMAVLETGYGKSRFAKDANNLFGIRTWDENEPQLKPLELPDAEFGVKKYPTKCDSVEDMIDIINRLPAYEDFRIERESQLQSGKIDLDKQIELLSKWSTNPKYTELVKSKGKSVENILENKLAK